MANTKKDEIEVTTETPATTTKAPEMNEYQRREAYKKENDRLIRCRITPLDPLESKATGFMFSTGNKILGDRSYVIMYNNITHLPNFIIKNLQERTFNKRIPRKDPRKPPKIVEVPKYAIEILPPLTPQELADLADQQRKRGSFEDDED